jgi:pimeloyl-ACP methyl ester carboxylesterase
MASWTDGYWWSKDGLRLHYRDYAGGGDGRPPILCIHGLTRNARDFEAVADRLAGDWRIVAVDLRGRGESAYASDPLTYVPLVYLQDLEALVAELKLDRFILFGTSLGGILAMLLARGSRDRLAAVLLNDIGPAIDPAGLERIRNYVGKSQSWPTWLHAARYFAEEQADIHPAWSLERWLVYATRLCRVNAQGRVVRDYDPRIAEPFRAPGADAALDMWSTFAALKGIPALVVRGQDSDILSPATFNRMKKERPGLDAVTVPGTGHAPTLEEPEAVAAIDQLLSKATAR